MGFARLDHLIVRVPDIAAAHRRFTHDLGFDEAWPIGPFWPNALTSGVAVGGLNLEFLQPLDGSVTEAYADTMVFEPTSLDATEAALLNAGVPVRRFDKIEPDSELLRLRSFDAEAARTPQRICTNLLPEAPAPIDFFVCEYVPFLKARLAPTRFAAPRGQVVATEATVPDPDAASAFLASVGYQGIPIEFGVSHAPRVIALQFEDGSRLTLE